MAVYQYYLAIVPKQGIEKKHDSIPNEIRVSSETGYFESDAKIYWKEVKMQADDIVSKVDLIIKRANWENNKTSIYWKTYNDLVDNDVAIFLNEESMSIRDFSFRVDLRENDLTFLKNMIELGNENGWLFMDRKGKLMKPDFEEIKNSIRNSNAHRYLKDPIKFLQNIDKKK
ncbi:hypothetical protein [Carboxylicivirga sp. N1Y90]|uniref:hypothetical protein n=1 Tax=Carboxylicivirga fragile TaxID=3417571 RepID=UPI003D34C0C1|nr:hypothetical protein [Marinilabiliaceae bacterium N1Y90]